MKILYINHYAGSKKMGMEFRPYYLSKIWTKIGHKVTIVGSSFSHLRVQQPVVNFPISSDVIDGINFLWIKCYRYAGNGYGRLVNISQFLFGLFYYRKQILDKSRPDVIIASSTYPMDIWAAKYLARISKARLVFELHDVWPQSLTEIAGLSRFHPMVIIAGLAEKTVYNSADTIISMLPGIHSHCKEFGFNTANLTIVPNGIVIEDWSIDELNFFPEEILNSISEARAKDHLIVCYAGAHGEPNALENLINAAEILKNKPISFILVGDGNIKIDLEKLVESKCLNNIAMFKGISKNLIPKLLHMVDIGFIGAKDRPIYKHGISPNKIADYMMAQLPIICAINSGNNPVKEAKCGIIVSPEDPEELASAITYIDSIGIDKRRLLGKMGKDFVIKNYAYEALAKKFLTALK